MTTYTWTITELYTKAVGEFADYVVTAQFNVTGVDGEFSYTIGGSQQFEVKEGQEFVPYAELTEATVVSWIKEELGTNGVLSITACIDGQIASHKNPPVVPQIAALPW